MNRRELITGAAYSVVGLAAGAVGVQAARPKWPLNTVMTFAPCSWRIETARRMVNESGEMWLATCERSMRRNPILIAFDDDRGVEISRARNHWKLIERTLTSEEIAGRDKCRRDHRLAFYSYNDRKAALLPLPEPRIGQAFHNQPYRLRAWIKNGRRPEWQMSIDGYRKPVTP